MRDKIFYMATPRKVEVQKLRRVPICDVCAPNVQSEIRHQKHAKTWVSRSGEKAEEWENAERTLSFSLHCLSSWFAPCYLFVSESPQFCGAQCTSNLEGSMAPPISTSHRSHRPWYRTEHSAFLLSCRLLLFALLYNTVPQSVERSVCFSRLSIHGLSTARRLARAIAMLPRDIAVESGGWLGTHLLSLRPLEATDGDRVRISYQQMDPRAK
jgi:hypothetical protein